MTRQFSVYLFLVFVASSSVAQDHSIVRVSNVDFQNLSTEGFVLTQDQQVTLEATLLEPGSNMPSPTQAWIIDGVSRKIVWEANIDSGSETAGPLVVVKETLRLPAGPYEAYYSGYADWRYTGRWKNVRGIADVVHTVLNEIFDSGNSSSSNDLEDSFDENSDRLGVTVYAGSGRAESNSENLSAAFLENAFLTITGVGDEAYVVEGFSLSDDTNIEVYSLGEVEREGRYDYSWIIDVDSRETVWMMDYDNSVPAGGAWKNRVARQKLSLPAGSYAAFYVSDGSHSAAEWNSPPPYDPDFWGITLKVFDKRNLSSVGRFEYQNVDLKKAVVALRQVSDDEHRSAGFSIKNPSRVRIYSVGEGSSNEMYDYAWIVDAATRQRVWTMRYDETLHAGGSRKNRVFDGTIDLPAGDYVVHYVTDGSHAFGDWNSEQPYDIEAWGVTVLPGTGNTDANFSSYDELSDRNVLARIAAVRDDAYKRFNFELAEDTSVRIYALGEGDDGEMYDYGWIENSSSGKVVWEMTYRMSEHAGGSSKNRMVNSVIGLPAGSYTVYFQTDGSHAFGDWNASAPSDPENWGITIMSVDN
ncbi:MAG: hypothetical protein HKN43_07495 [Rhodothermales bacterium]|nr:hypothetical protein [Rhodothermales bacterium]